MLCIADDASWYHFGSNGDAVVRTPAFDRLAREGDLGYPIRGLRTRDFLYLRNFAPERWPAGDPPIYGDVDQAYSIADSPSKQAAVVRHARLNTTRTRT